MEKIQFVVLAVVLSLTGCQMGTSSKGELIKATKYMTKNIN